MSNFAAAATPRVGQARARYIKLGPKGCWEDEAIAKGILIVGFDTGDPETFELCAEGRWDALAAEWARSKSKGVATRFTNETRFYFEDPGDTLWFTFAHDRLYWGYLEPGLPQPCDPRDPANTTTFRRIRGGWADRDQRGKLLTKTSLPGSITAAASFRGTSFELAEYDRERLLQRIRGIHDPAVERVQRAQAELRASLGEVVQRLDDRDFETLVDMLFLAAGWRRVGRLGGTQKTKDLDLRMPVTGERAWVQVKCATTPQEFAGYVRAHDRMEQYQRMFFVYHRGETIRSDRDDIEVLGVAEVVDMVVNGGFVDWVLERAG